MPWLDRLFRERRSERQLDSELRFHVEQQIRDYTAQGMNAEEARRRVRVEFGGIEQIKEECRDERSFHWVDSITRDFRCALRQQRRSPGFVLSVLATLGLCIGVNTAVYSVVDSL